MKAEIYILVTLCFAVAAAGNPWTPEWPCGIGVLPQCNDTGTDHTVIGTEEDVYTEGIEDLVVTISDNELSSQNSDFTGVQEVMIVDSEEPIVSFDFNFTNSSLNLSGVRVKRQTERYGFTIISNLSINTTKTLFIPRISMISKVCVKDAPMQDISEITDFCSGPDETYFNPCNGRTINGLTCSIEGNNYKVEGLSHSGGKEQPPETKKGYFTVEYLQRGPDYKEGYLSPGDIVKLCFECADSIRDDEFLIFRFIPETGIETIAEFTTPYVLSTEREYMYP